MNWYYVQAGNSIGPIDQAEFDSLVRSGVIQSDTLVWQEGMASWKPYSIVRPTAAPAVMGNAGPAPDVAPIITSESEVVCAECNKVFPREDAIQYGTVWVCGDCKPAFVQKLREGAATPQTGWRTTGLPEEPDELARIVRERDYSVSIGDCLNRSWELLKGNFGLLVGGTALSLILQQAIGLIPIVGAFIQVPLYGVFTAGLYVLYLNCLRGQNAALADIFSGFSGRFLHLVLTTVVQTLIVAAIAGVAALIAALLLPLLRRSNVNPWILLALAPVVIVPMAYLTVSWVLSLPLVIDRGLNFWAAMEVSRKVVSRHWWTFLGLLFVGTVLGLSGIIACFIGIVLTMPILFGMVAYAYDDIFGSGRALKS